RRLWHPVAVAGVVDALIFGNAGGEIEPHGLAQLNTPPYRPTLDLANGDELPKVLAVHDGLLNIDPFGDVIGYRTGHDGLVRVFHQAAGGEHAFTFGGLVGLDGHVVVNVTA